MRPNPQFAIRDPQFLTAPLPQPYRASVGANRRRELGKFVLDLGRLIFAGTVLAQLLPGARLSAAVLAFGALATVAAVSIGLAIIPEEAK